LSITDNRNKSSLSILKNIDNVPLPAAETSLQVDPSNTTTTTTTTATDVWSELVTELRRQIAFLELDRSEVVRTTQAYLEEERTRMDLKVQAAASTARREGYERAQAVSQQHFQQFFA
jgi:phage tail sheath protein FI